jgi:hypothetical protein
VSTASAWRCDLPAHVVGGSPGRGTRPARGRLRARRGPSPREPARCGARSRYQDADHASSRLRTLRVARDEPRRGEPGDHDRGRERGQGPPAPPPLTTYAGVNDPPTIQIAAQAQYGGTVLTATLRCSALLTEDIADKQALLGRALAPGHPLPALRTGPDSARTRRGAAPQRAAGAGAHPPARGDRAIATGLNRDGVPCPSVRRPDQNRHRLADGWQGAPFGPFWRPALYGLCSVREVDQERRTE